MKYDIKPGANLFEADLAGATLTNSDLSGANLNRAILVNADFRGAKLVNTNFKKAWIALSDLSGTDISTANFEYARMSEVKLLGAKLPEGIPVIRNIHQKVYRAASAKDALDMTRWHDYDGCNTTHCRAGWVVTLAGEKGLELEKKIGTSAAAALIYQASDPALERVPDWYCWRRQALTDMARLARLEAKFASS